MPISKVFDPHEAKKLGFYEDEGDEQEEDFISSDYCFECGGTGKLWNKRSWEQCESCEELHLAEIRADRAMDAQKEGA